MQGDDLTSWLDDLTVDVVVMMFLTAIIAGSAVYQARVVRKQAAFMREVEERRTRPTATVALSSHDVDHKAPDGSYATTTFEGFAITNTSPLEITITGWSLQLGVEEEGTVSQRTTQPRLAISHKGGALSDLGLPRRLKYGESARALFDVGDLVASLRGEDGRVARARPEFQDSLGNTYSVGGWVTWAEGRVGVYGDPGNGLLTPEEKRRLLERRNRRGRFWSWLRRGLRR